MDRSPSLFVTSICHAIRHIVDQFDDQDIITSQWLADQTDQCSIGRFYERGGTSVVFIGVDSCMGRSTFHK
jgi:hypothetical protein